VLDEENSQGGGDRNEKGTRYDIDVGCHPHARQPQSARPVVRPPAACLRLCYERQVPNALNATVDAPSPYTSTFQTLVPTGPLYPMRLFMTPYVNS